MKNELTRENYKVIKKRYYIFLLFLRIFRILGIVSLVFIFLVSIVYTNNPDNAVVKYLKDNMNVLRKILYGIIITWLFFKIIVVIIKNNLRKIKYRLDIIDEI